MELKMMICERCGINGNIVRLFDAIYDGKMSLLCERCSIIENSPIIKKPNSIQLKEFEKRTKVYDRMRFLIGKRENEKQDTFFIGDRLRELDNNPRLELPEENQLNLIDNFHWEIMKIRRRKGLTKKQLGEAIGESEIVIDIIERGKLPESPESLIKKIEQFFQINLRKINYVERMVREKERELGPILLDEEGNKLESIPEEKITINNGNEKSEVTDSDKETEDFELKKIDASKITIDDLRKIHKKKIEATKSEQKEEQKKIEEKERKSEALRERERLKVEERKKEVEKNIKKEESKDVFKKLGGTELL